MQYILCIFKDIIKNWLINKTTEKIVTFEILTSVCSQLTVKGPGFCSVLSSELGGWGVGEPLRSDLQFLQGVVGREDSGNDVGQRVVVQLQDL